MGAEESRVLADAPDTAAGTSAFGVSEHERSATAQKGASHPDFPQCAPLLDQNRRDAFQTLQGLLDALVVANGGDKSFLLERNTDNRSRSEGREPSSANRGPLPSEVAMAGLPEKELQELFAPFSTLSFANYGLTDADLLTTRLSVASEDAGSPDRSSAEAAVVSVSALNLLALHPYLVSLDLSFNALSGAGVAALVDSLRRQNASASAAAATGQRAAQRLTNLSLSGNAIGKDGCAALASWLSCSGETEQEDAEASACPIEVLSLFHCSLNDEAVVTLLSGLMKAETCLRVLDLNFNHITVEGSLTFLKEEVLRVNTSLAVVSVESVRYDPVTLSPSPVDGEKRIPQACTPCKGRFRPVSVSGATEGSNDGKREETGKESERLLLRRRFLKTNFAGVAPLSHRLLSDMNEILESRRLAYVQQQEAAKAATISRAAFAAVHPEVDLTHPDNGDHSGCRDPNHSVTNGTVTALSTQLFLSASAQGTEDSICNDDDKETDGEGAEEEEALPDLAVQGDSGAQQGEVRTAHGDADKEEDDEQQQRQQKLGGLYADMYNERQDTKNGRSYGAGKHRQISRKKLTASKTKYSEMEAPARIAQVMADAYAFRERHNPELTRGAGVTPLSATFSPASAFSPSTALLSNPRTRRLYLQGTIVPFQYKSGFDVVVEMPRSVAKDMEVFDASVLRSTERGFGGSRKVRVAEQDILHSHLQACWCEPSEATVTFGGTLHYHCRHEGSAFAATNASHGTAAGQQERKSLLLPSLLSPASSRGGGGRPPSSSSYVGCHGTGHRCTSANQRSERLASSSSSKGRSPGMPFHSTSVSSSYLPAVGSASWGSGGGGATYESMGKGGNVTFRGEGGTASSTTNKKVQYSPVAYFTAPYQRCAVIVDECRDW